MTSPPLPARLVGIAALGVTVFGWGLGWVATKIVLQAWTPLFARGLAGLIAAACFALLAVLRRERLNVPRQAFPRLAFAAFTNVFAWMGFPALCLNWLSVSEGALLVFTMPIWANLFAWLLLGTRPTPIGMVALLLGLAGVAVLLGGGPPLAAGQWLGIVFALSAAVLFALGAVLNANTSSLPAIPGTAWQVGLGSLPMLLIGLAVEKPDVSALGGEPLWAFVYMAAFPIGICFLTWFAALRRLPPATVSTGTLLVPVVGIVSASILLHEALGGREIAAVLLTLSGVALALRRPRTR